MENHIQISSRVNNGNFPRAIERALSLIRSLNNRFEFSHDLGYLTSSPDLIGTGLRIKVVVNSTSVTQKQNFEHFEGVNLKFVSSDSLEISNKKTLGVSEVEVIGFVYKVAEFIVNEEKKSRDHAHHKPLMIEETPKEMGEFKIEAENPEPMESENKEEQKIEVTEINEEKKAEEVGNES